MKIIDAHLHFVPENPYFQEIAVRAEHKNTEEDLRAVYQKYNIEGGVVMGNRGVDPVDHSYPEFLRDWVGIERGCLVREENKMYVTDEVYEPLYDLAKAYKKPVAIHMGQTAGSRAYLKYSHPLTLDEAAVRHPDVNFVMCHFGNPWLLDAAAVVEKNENVMTDLSGLLEGKIDFPKLLEQQRGYFDALKTWISYCSQYEKFMFGTDWPLANYGDYIEVVKWLIPEEEWGKVFYENAKRIYGL